MESKKLGVIVSVEGDVSQVGMYNLSNDSSFLWYGEILNGPRVGSYLTINQNDIKIIATVVMEKVIDQQNTVRSREFDNRYKKDSINRLVSLKTKGVIVDGKFKVTSQYVPMIGNEVTITTKEELDIIYSIEDSTKSIEIGNSLLENYPVEIDIDRFFASHIGIFGNTGSGKSNTLHKLYLELFRKKKYLEKIKEHSQFFVIDFNGEYTGDDSFSLKNESGKKIYEIKTNTQTSDSKIPIKKEYLFDADILSILFDARPATQVPFLRKAMRKWDEQKFTGDSISKFVVGTLKKILTTSSSVKSDAKDNWIEVAEKYVNNANLFLELKELNYNSHSKAFYYKSTSEKVDYINDKGVVEEKVERDLKIIDITNSLKESYEKLNEIEKLKFYLLFQKVHQSSWESTNIEHINPLFNRIESSFTSLQKVVEVVDEIDNEYTTLNIVSLVHANQEIKRLIPMLLSKMIYDEQKKKVAGKKVTKTNHLIIDEAHNILNPSYRDTGDSWQDYRLSVFEEIIKEGRKFGFYLTLSSQRPADISSTILSQTHNYLIHRLVNEKDLRMLENTMPTLDTSSYKIIPSLGQGEAIVTGSAINIPIFVKIGKEEKLRPSSDDIKLTDIWETNGGEV